MTDAPDAAGGSKGPLLWPGYLVGGFLLTVASVVVAFWIGPVIEGWNAPLLTTLFYGVVLSAPLAKAGHLCLRCFVTKERRPWLAFTLGAAGPWALMVGVLFGPSFLEYLGRRDFDSEAWQAVSTRRTQERIKMVDDLIDSGVLDHLPRARVAELLGDDDSDSGYFADWDVVYWLGDERSFFSIDSEWLVIRFDDGGRVRDYRLVRD